MIRVASANIETGIDTGIRKTVLLISVRLNNRVRTKTLTPSLERRFWREDVLLHHHCQDEFNKLTATKSIQKEDELDCKKGRE